MKYIKTLIIIGSFFLILFMACSSNKKEITLKNWIENNTIYLEYIAGKPSDCNTTKTVYERLTLEEFKIKLYSDLANCSHDNKAQQKEYLIENASSGLHPDRIDSVKYASLYPEVKERLHEGYKNFWQERDTTYFAELEERVALDQNLYRAGLSDSTNATKDERRSVFKENTQYLLKYCKKNGFPFKPGPRNFNSFRTGIDPTVIAIHANHKDKVKLLNYAIESAKEGIISWSEPITICVTFHTNSVTRTSVKPLFFLHFDKENKLDVNQSYLQLYSVAKLYGRDMKVPIKIQPSKFNSDKKAIISKQLKEIKDRLVNEFLYNPEEIIISENPDSNELKQEELTNYKFTLTELINNP